MPKSPGSTTVIFDMWGQRCETVFDSTSELDPITWLKTMYQWGWLQPVEIIGEGGVVLATQEKLLEEFKEL